MTASAVRYVADQGGHRGWMYDIRDAFHRWHVPTGHSDLCAYVGIVSGA